VIRLAPKAFIAELLFIDSLENMFLPPILELRTKFTEDGPSLLTLDGHSTHVTARVIAICAARKIILIRLDPHSSHLAQLRDLCVRVIQDYVQEREAKQGNEGRNLCPLRVL
jgi:hypothetical protein